MHVEDDGIPGSQDGGNGTYVLKIRNIVCDLKQAGYNWYHMLRDGLEKHVCVPSMIDECVFYSEGSVVLTYICR